MKEDQYLDNAEMLRVKRMQKEEYEEEERARAREREANLVKDMEKKEVRLIPIQLPSATGLTSSAISRPVNTRP